MLTHQSLFDTLCMKLKRPWNTDMTRINVVPVDTLTNQHALAEYKEITRVFGYVRKAQERGINKFNFHKKYDVHADYTLGTGHVLFFYNRLQFCLDRYHTLQVELTKRGYTLKPVSDSDLLSGIRSEWLGNYAPTENALKINAERISKRLSGDKT